MTMGLKIHKMMKEGAKDPPEIQDEAARRRDISDSVLEAIYNKLIDRSKKGKKRSSSEDCKEER